MRWAGFESNVWQALVLTEVHVNFIKNFVMTFCGLDCAFTVKVQCIAEFDQWFIFCKVVETHWNLFSEFKLSRRIKSWFGGRASWSTVVMKVTRCASQMVIWASRFVVTSCRIPLSQRTTSSKSPSRLLIWEGPIAAFTTSLLMRRRSLVKQWGKVLIKFNQKDLDEILMRLNFVPSIILSASLSSVTVLVMNFPNSLFASILFPWNLWLTHSIQRST